MLEIFDQNPASRVFHVDEECYVLYLGSHWDDYKPFLRLGTSVHLPTKLPRIVSTIVVPDVLTGSPLEEGASLGDDATSDTHYVGDVRTINKLKSFVGIESIAVEGLKRASRETDDNEHVFVYSYKDGNLKIKFHKSEIFDLRRRERQDLHYLARSQTVKNEYGKSPFRYMVDAYQRPGFVVAGGEVYVISHGEIAVPNLRDNYFAELAAVGVDPDRVAAVRAEKVNTALLRVYKRCRAKERVPRIATKEKDVAKALAGVFRANSLPALKVSLLDSDGDTFEFHRQQIAAHSGWSKVSFPDLDGPVVFGSAPSSTASAMVVNYDSGRITLGKRDLPLIEGFIHQFDLAPLTRTEVQSRYLPEKNYPYRDMLSSDENNLIDQIGYYFSEMFAGRDPGRVMKTLKANAIVRDFGRGQQLDPVASIAIFNASEFARFIAKAEPDLERYANQLAGALDRHSISPSAIPGHLPVIAEIRYHEGSPYFFFRLGSRITSDRVAHAERVVENIVAVPRCDYEGERARLVELIDGIADPDQMEEARLRKIAERKKPAPKPPEEVKDSKKDETREEAAAAGLSRASARSGATARSRATSRSRGSRRRGPWVWLIPLIVVLLLLGLAALLYTGVIPNPWFGERARTDQTQGVSPGETGDGSTGTEESTGTATGDQGSETEGTGTEVGQTDGGEQGDSTVQGDRGETGQTGQVTPGTEGTEGSEAEQPQIVPPDWEGGERALAALEDIEGVTITRDAVIGPGGIVITLLDIINLVNRIAVENGYKRMDSIDPDLPDPDWIYPGNVFVLPDGSRYTVVEGDSLWVITVRYMVERLSDDYRRYVDLTSEYDRSTTTGTRRQQIRSELQAIGDGSHSQNFAALVREKLNEWRE